MSKQTINIGASPNDGTGTPLRTSFDYTNQNFTELYTAVGPSGNNIVVPGNATITGDLTVDTSTLKVDSTNNRVIVGHTSGSAPFQVTNAGAAGLEIHPTGGSSAPLIISYNRSGLTYTQLTIDASTIVYALNGSTAMTLNSTGLGVGVVPSAARLEVGGQDGTQFYIRSTGTTPSKIRGFTNAAEAGVIGFLNGGGIYFDISGERMRIDSSGNVGIGVTPSAWGGSYKSVQVNEAGGFAGKNDGLIVAQNCYFDGTNWVNNRASTFSSRYDMNVAGNGIHAWYVYNASFGTVGNTIPFTQAMTLDASGNLLVGTTSATAGVVFKVTGTVANSRSFEVYGTASGVNPAFFCPGGGSVNGVATGANVFGLVIVNKDSGNLRSISAAGSLNASGADYAEYMTKSGDFVIAKGDVAGIDANGKLTNVFADAVSFVVKSTDPSYVGNDKWGVDLEGSALEAARQLVDRVAFAGQVPVNVTGSKAGDYIVPVVDGTAIKGISVSNPTFEQYQLAVGKVIAIDTDGRARIIVKVA